MSKKALVYDISSTPDGVTLDKVIGVWKENDVIIYDSFKGKQPLIYDYEEIDGKLLDVGTADMETISEINKLLER